MIKHAAVVSLVALAAIGLLATYAADVPSAPLSEPGLYYSPK